MLTTLLLLSLDAYYIYRQPIHRGMLQYLLHFMPLALVPITR
jgi:hypothetical protein